MNEKEAKIREDIIEKFYFNAVKGLSDNPSILFNYDEWTSYCSDLPKKEFVVYIISLFDTQVKNGGFHQYFFNSYGIFCFQAIEKLKLINCIRHAEILEKAINIIRPISIDNEIFRRDIFNRKNKIINSFSDKVFQDFEPLEDEYYKIEENEIVFNELSSYLLK